VWLNIMENLLSVLRVMTGSIPTLGNGHTLVGQIWQKLNIKTTAKAVLVVM